MSLLQEMRGQCYKGKVGTMATVVSWRGSTMATHKQEVPSKGRIGRIHWQQPLRCWPAGWQPKLKGQVACSASTPLSPCLSFLNFRLPSTGPPCPGSATFSNLSSPILASFSPWSSVRSRDRKLPALRYGPEGLTGSKKKVPNAQERIVLGEGDRTKGHKLSVPLPTSSLCHCPFCASSPPKHQGRGNVLVITTNGSCWHCHLGLRESSQLYPEMVCTAQRQKCSQGS